MEKFKTILLGVLGVICIILYINMSNTSKEYGELQTLHSNSISEIEFYKDKDSLSGARINVLQSENTELFTSLSIKDSSIIALQKIVEENKRYLKNRGSVSTIGADTDINAVSPTEIIYQPIDSLPTYKSNFNLGGWVYGNSIATKDSTYLDLKIKNDFRLIIGEEPQGFLGLGKAIPFADIKSLNPYSEIKSFRTYQVTKPNRKNFSLGPSLNVGVDFTGKIYTTIGVSLQPDKLTIKF